jgi:hypothetical protein
VTYHPRPRYKRRPCPPAPRAFYHEGENLDSLRDRINKPFYDALMRLGPQMITSYQAHVDDARVRAEAFVKAITPEPVNLGAKLEIPRERPHQPWVYPDLGGLDAQATSLVEALVTPPEKSWVKPTTTGGTAQRGWLAEEGVWPPEKVKHAWDNWTDEDRATERENWKKP